MRPCAAYDTDNGPADAARRPAAGDGQREPTGPAHVGTGETTGIDDARIVELVIGGDVDRFAVILERHRRYVFGIVAGHVPAGDVDETAHDVFVRAYRSLPSWSGAGEFRHWLAGIAVRTCRDFWRKRYRRRETAMSNLSEDQAKRIERTTPDTRSVGVDELLERREAEELLQAAMGGLSPTDRTILQLVNIEGRPVAEAAALLGLGESNVKVRGFRARRKLRTVLERMLRGETDMP